jgi:hypothetical protein
VYGSRFSETVLPAALSLADDLGAEIVPVRVDPRTHDILRADEDNPYSPGPREYHPVVAIRQYLEGLAARMQAAAIELSVAIRQRRLPPPQGFSAWPLEASLMASCNTATPAGACSPHPRAEPATCRGSTFR